MTRHSSSSLPGKCRLVVVALGLFSLSPEVLPQSDVSGEIPEEGPVLDRRTAEHMFNRFAFGASESELGAVVGLRSTELFDRWVAKSCPPEQPKPKYFSYWEYGYDANGHELTGAPILSLPREELVKRQNAMRSSDKYEFRKYLDDLLEGMVTGRDPLRDRLALFWHGFFPTSSKVSLRHFELILQYHFLRTHALDGFDVLLRGIVKDPAMLGYFDNDTNSKSHPNENFARELMELYSLGVGNYTEVDVREAARALTGFQGETGHFVFDEDLHDFGEKTILGQSGPFDGRNLVEIILQQEACSTYVARRLLRWMEGPEPGPERLGRYAKLLRRLDYKLTPWLRRLAADPEFFRDEIVGTRVLGPIEFFVGASHRLALAKRETFLYFAAAVAGQQLYGPPSVKGWDEGSAWITNSTMRTRGNGVGLLLGHFQDHLKEKAADGEVSARDVARIEQMVVQLRANNLQPPRLIGMALKSMDQEAADERILNWIAESCLARTPTPSALEELALELAWCREHFEVQGPLLGSPSANQILCHLAYILLRMPIAQLG